MTSQGTAGESVENMKFGHGEGIGVIGKISPDSFHKFCGPWFLIQGKCDIHMLFLKIFIATRLKLLNFTNSVKEQSMQKINRCAWADPQNLLYIQYHDEEWGRPLHDELRLFEMLILEGAQAGLSWITILKKREAYRKAFDNFDPQIVSSYGEEKVASLLANPGIVRNRLKIRGAVKNAEVFMAIQKEFGDDLDVHLLPYAAASTLDPASFSAWVMQHGVRVTESAEPLMAATLHEDGQDYH